MLMRYDLKDRTKLLVLIFFLTFLALGLFIFSHYGIHVDGPALEKGGERFAQYIQNFDILKPIPYPLNFRHDASHGPVFELFLCFVKRCLNLSDPRDVVLMRHLCNFLLFYLSVLFFYRLGRLYFKDRGLALLGCLFLVLNPRIFSNAFYNSTDIPFLTFYIISTYTLFLYLQKRTIGQAVWHALSCAILTNIRMAGCLIAILTVFIFLLDFFKPRKDAVSFKGAAVSLGVFICLFLELSVLFHPYLWVFPGKRLFNVLRAANLLWSDAPPWYYTPVWILVTTPPLYLFLFLVGLFFSVGSFLRQDPLNPDQRVQSRIIFSLFFIPLVVPILLKTYLFCDWRHHYFVYPMIVLIALLGVKGCLGLIHAKMEGRGLRIVRSVFFAVVGLCLAATAWTLVTLHPYQNIYFNFLKSIPFVERLCIYIPSDKNPDYWRLSTRAALMKVLEQDIRPVIRVNIRPDMAALIPAEDRKRLVFTHKYSDVEYFFASARSDLPSGAPFKEFYSVVVNGEKIRTIYKRTPRPYPHIVPYAAMYPRIVPRFRKGSILKCNTHGNLLTDPLPHGNLPAPFAESVLTFPKVDSKNAKAEAK